MTMRQTARDAITALTEQFEAASRRQDAAAMAELYTEDGQFFPLGSDVVTGRQAIQAAYQSLLDLGAKAIRLENDEVEDFGDTAVAVGRYTLEGDGGHVLDRGHYISVLKQEGGQWRYHRDIGTSSTVQLPPSA
jgi:uncharacterized protein (TIGR02246 family)